MNKQDVFKASSFIAVFCPKRLHSESGSVYREFEAATGIKPHIPINTKDFYICIAVSKPEQVAVDHSSGTILILNGEVYNSKAYEKQAEYLLKQFIDRGIGFVKDINGSFAILLINEQNNFIAVITDRINSRKVFHSKLKGDYWISTSLSLHPTKDAGIDPVGVACYLANGAVHNNRTLFDGVRVMERACVHKLAANGFNAERYWSYEFINSYTEADEKKLISELSELLVESVRIRLHNNPRVFVSVSGGYDSAGILGILGYKLKVPDVCCISYASGKQKVNTDAHVSAQMAKLLGYEHRTMQSHKGNLLETIKHNADMAQGNANFCDELDVWLELSDEFSAKVPSVLFAGDNCFGFDSRVKMNSLEDALVQHNQIFEFDTLNWLSDMIGPAKYKMLCEGLHEDIKQIVKRSPPYNNYYDLGSFIYLDQRVGNVLLNWRQDFPGSFLYIHEPYFDNAILDFMMKVPSYMRFGRRLYRKTVIEMFPELFQIKRATMGGGVKNWREEFISQHKEIEQSILSYQSRLDDLIPQEVILKLLLDIRSWKHHKYSPRILPSRIAFILLKGGWLTNKILNIFPIIDHKTMLKRLLVMRLVLKKTVVTKPVFSQTLNKSSF